MPDVPRLPADTRLETVDQSLDSAYSDTENRDLLAYGVTLRCRTGTADNG